ncbi:hypothetical protein ABZY09_13885 [Streptomyces sp. NPDC002928]|uniref:hypothetical protein n=1 Tax=Streptomyces sp. NPDC002928 TaxID=3154440 RepID=UPI0033AAC873
MRAWIRQVEADAGERDDRLTTAAKAANEVLRTASASFAAQLGPDPAQVTPLLDEHPHLGDEPVLRELHVPSSTTYYR